MKSNFSPFFTGRRCRQADEGRRDISIVRFIAGLADKLALPLIPLPDLLPVKNGEKFDFAEGFANRQRCGDNRLGTMCAHRSLG